MERLEGKKKLDELQFFLGLDMVSPSPTPEKKKKDMQMDEDIISAIISLWILETNLWSLYGCEQAIYAVSSKWQHKTKPLEPFNGIKALNSPSPNYWIIKNK